MPNDLLQAMYVYNSNPFKKNWVKFEQLTQKSGININAQIKNGKALLHHAVALKAPKVYKHLVKIGADWTITDICNKNIFHYISMSGDLKAAQYFYHLNAKKTTILLNSPDASNDTPLHTAIRNEQTTLISHYRDWGAKPDKKPENLKNIPIFFAYPTKDHPTLSKGHAAKTIEKLPPWEILCSLKNKNHIKKQTLMTP